MKSFKKILSFLLVATMILGITPMLSYAADTEVSAVVDGDTLTISFEGDLKDYGRQGASAAPWAEMAKNVQTVVFSEGIKKIGNNALVGLTNITEIQIPKSVETISSSAFVDLTGLTSYVVNSDNKTFASKNGILYSAKMDTIISYPLGKTDTSLDILAKVTTIAAGAFAGVTALKSIRFHGTKEAWEKVTKGANNNILNSIAVSFIINGVSVSIEENIGFLYCFEHEKYVSIQAPGLSFHVRRDFTAIDRVGVDIAERYENGQSYTLNLYLDLEKDYVLADTLTKAKVNGTDYTMTVDANGLVTIKDIKLKVSGNAEDHKHDYTRTETAPKCEDEGTVTYTCTLCKNTYNGNPIPALGHIWDEYTFDDEHHTHVCQNEECQKVETKTHRFSEFASDNNNGFFKNGTETKYCYDCGFSVTQVIPNTSFVVSSFMWLLGYIAFSGMGIAQPFHLLYDLVCKVLKIKTAE